MELIMAKEKEPLKTLRDNLYAVMYQKDWSPMHLSIECGISYETLRRILALESKNIWLSTIISIAEGLEVPVYSLFDDRKAV